MHSAFLIVAFLFITLTSADSPTQGTIPLPRGFGPEGIAKGQRNTLFVGNVRNGAIYRLNIRTKKSRILVKPFKNRVAVGLAVKNNKLFVAGGGQVPIGSGTTAFFYVYNTNTGKQIAACSITPASFLNDVTVRANKAYFSDSGRNRVFVVPINTVRSCKFTTIKLPKLFQSTGDGIPRANGIEFFKGRLLLANSMTNTIYVVDPEGRERTRPLMPPGSVEGPDGLVVKNRRLYIADIRAGKIRVWLLRKRTRIGNIKVKKLKSISSDTFNSPSTAAIIKDRLYVVNSRFLELELDSDVSRETFTISVIALH